MPNQLASACELSTQSLRLLVGYPDFRKEAARIKLGKGSGIDLIGLYLRVGNQPDLQLVCYCDPPYPGSQHAHDSECVPCCFQHDLVVGPKVVCKGYEAVLVELYSTQVT